MNLDDLTEAFDRFLAVEAPLLWGFRPSLSARAKEASHDAILRLDVMRLGIEFHAELEMPARQIIRAEADPEIWPGELDPDFRHFADGAARELGKLLRDAP